MTKHKERFLKKVANMNIGKHVAWLEWQSFIGDVIVLISSVGMYYCHLHLLRQLNNWCIIGIAFGMLMIFQFVRQAENLSHTKRYIAWRDKTGRKDFMICAIAVVLSIAVCFLMVIAGAVLTDTLD